MARPLKKTDIVLSNEVKLESRPITKSKGRHWVATQRGKVLGEFTTWQQTTYHRQKEGDYGRGGGFYETHMVRESWLASEGESPEKMNCTADLGEDARKFYEWKNKLREIPHPLVKKIA